MVIVLPARPPIDKLVAYKRVQLDREDDVRLEVAFCDVNEPTPMHLMVWGRSCSPDQAPYLLDVGSKKYHKLGSSAAEVEKMLADTENTRIYNRLVNLINENNRTGKLKGYRHSVAKLIREAYHVMLNADLSQEVVFDHGMDVVNAFFFPKNQREWSALFTDADYSKLKELWDGFNVSEAEILPFTLPLYFKQLFMSGRKEGEIVEKISWWIDKAKRIAAAKYAAQKKQYFCKPFNMPNGKQGCLTHVKSHFEAGAAQYQLTGSGKFAVGIFRNELGQVHIKTSFKHKGISLKAVYDVLNEIEPGRWYYENRFNNGQSEMLMNGSDQFTGIVPSNIPDHLLINIVVSLVAFDKVP
jgi:hypothetical protein